MSQDIYITFSEFKAPLENAHPLDTHYFSLSMAFPGKISGSLPRSTLCYVETGVLLSTVSRKTGPAPTRVKGIRAGHI